MNQFLAYWKKTKFTDRLSRFKQVYIEQRDAVGFSAVLTNFTKFMDNFCTRSAPNSRADKCKERGLQPSSVTGAIFFGVCRGKISEGIDFKDYMARAVISLSIPYSNTRSHEIQLMREYMDQQHQLNPAVQDGSSWYEEQAFRALNQGLGRCIRHSRDYGAIILLESRFGNAEMKKRLSRWFRDEIRVSRSDVALIQGLKAFFTSCEKAFPAENSENGLERTQSTLQRGVSLTQESTTPLRMRSECEMGERMEEKERTGTIPSIVRQNSSEEREMWPQNEEGNGVSTIGTERNARLGSSESNAESILSQQNTQSKSFDANSMAISSMKRTTSTSFTLPTYITQFFTQPSTQLTTQSLKRLHTEPLLCPVCSQKLSDSSWEEIELTLQYGKELVQMALMTIQMHGYNVETGEEGVSMKAKLLDTEFLIPIQHHTSLTCSGTANRDEDRSSSSLYYHSKDKILFD